MKKLLVAVLLLAFAMPLFAGKILFMKPIAKGIEKSDAKKIERNIEKIFKKKFNYKSYRKLSKSLYKRLKKCRFSESCWSDKGADKGFDFVLTTLIKMNDDDEITVRFAVIDIEEEEFVKKAGNMFEDIDDISVKALYKYVKKVVKPISRKISKGKKKKKTRSYDDDDDDEDDDQEEIRRRKKVEKQRRLKRERDRRKREEALEIAREKRERDRARKEKARRIAKEKKRRKEEAERKKLEKLKKKRDAQKRKKAKNKRATLEKNAGKLERARDLVLEMCSGGKYNKAIKAIIKVSKIKCECEEDAKILALKTQLLNFNKVRKKIQQGVELLNGSLILDNIEAAQALDQEIVEGGTSFSEKVEKITAVGYYAKGLEMEKKDNYILANEFFEKCNSADPDKKECADWLENKDKIVKKLYDKAAVMKNFAPSKAKNLFRAILKLVTAEHEFYKKAEKDLQKMEY